MSNILFLRDYYEENLSPNGLCCKNIVNEFVKNGHNVVIGCYRPEEVKKEEVIDNIKLYKIWSFPKERKHKNVLEKIMFYLKWLNPLSPRPATENKAKTKATVCRIKEIILKEKIDTIISIYLPIENLIAVKEIKKEFPMIKTVAYMLDAFSGGIYPRFLPKKLCLKKTVGWEEKLLNGYDSIVIMDSAKDHYNNNTYNKKWMERAVYADIPMFIPKETSYNTTFPKEEIKIAFVGTIGEGIRTPYHFLKVINHIKHKKIHLIFAGKNLCKHKIKEFVKDNPKIRISELGVIPHKAAERILSEADILLNLGNENIFLVPSKIFEYMSFGKPIITTFISKQDSSKKYLYRYPNILELDEKNTNYANQAKQIYSFIEDINYKKINIKDLSPIFYKNLPSYFYDIMYELKLID